MTTKLKLMKPSRPLRKKASRLSRMLDVPGIHAIICDEFGNEIPAGSGKANNICIQNPWPRAFQTIWGDRERYAQTYYATRNKDSNHWRD